MTRVAIIGSGPSGLAQLQAFAAARAAGTEIPEVVCFEKQSDWGGLWNYTWRTGLDEHGDPVHGSMYRYLWSNGPKECLEFADYPFDEHFGKPIPSFPPREVLYDYITGRSVRAGVRDFIQFNQAVRWVSWDGSAFSLTVEDRETKAQRTEAFDYVIVATGHFSTPNVPDYPGFKTFPGRIMHSHDFRDASEFAGKDLLVMGSSYSAEDIALQSAKYGARSVTISYRTAPMGFGWPDAIGEVPGLVRMDGRTAVFTDGTSREVDAIVLCTGYQHNFPFVAEDLRLRTANLLCTPNLYNGVLWLDNPRLMYLGMQDQYYTFSMFDLQAWYARDVILGRLSVPGRAEMAANIDGWTARLGTLRNPEEEIDFQADYLRDLIKTTDYPAFDLDVTDSHTMTVTGVSADGVKSGLPDSATLLSWLSFGPLSDSGNGAAGSDTWSFSAQDHYFDYLADGETATLTYTVELDDHHGGIVSQPVRVTIAGSDNAVPGTEGADVLVGTSENDLMTGLAGNDQFVFNTALGSTGHDSIADFVPGQDKISLDYVAFDTYGSNDFSHWLASHAVPSGTGVLIDLNPGGSHPNQDTILLKNLTMANLHASDFILPSGGG